VARLISFGDRLNETWPPSKNALAKPRQVHPMLPAGQGGVFRAHGRILVVASLQSLHAMHALQSSEAAPSTNYRMARGLVIERAPVAA
jgi:hypothetical protein